MASLLKKIYNKGKETYNKYVPEKVKKVVTPIVKPVVEVAKPIAKKVDSDINKGVQTIKQVGKKKEEINNIKKEQNKKKEEIKKREEEKSVLEIIYPSDGVISTPSPIMSIKEELSASKNMKAVEAVTDWFLSPEGQQAIVAGWMHSVLKNPEKAPYDAIPTSEVLKSAMPINWESTYKNRESLRLMFEKNILKSK